MAYILLSFLYGDYMIDSIKNKKNVIGHGVGKKITGGKVTDENCIAIFVDKKLTPDAISKKDMIPKKINGIKTDVVETGKITLMNIDPRSKIRPAQGGCSISSTKTTAGTFGMVVRKDVADNSTELKKWINYLYNAFTRDDFYKKEARLVISNNHVLANDAFDNKEKDYFLQPGNIDGGVLECIVGKLYEYVPYIHNGRGENIVDCALAIPLNDMDVSDEIIGIGKPLGIGSPVVGMDVKKSGRTSGVTTGKIQYIDVSVTVNVGIGGDLIFKEQVMTTKMIDPGDSGSIMFDNNNKVIGMFFAGSSTFSIANKIDNVINELKIKI